MHMRKLAVLLPAALVLATMVCAHAEPQEDVADLTGDWTMDYFGIPMNFTFHEDGTCEGLIAMDIQADEGNDFAGTWEFDGATCVIHGEDGDASFTWDGEKLTGVMHNTEVFLLRAATAGVE